MWCISPNFFLRANSHLSAFHYHYSSYQPGRLKAKTCFTCEDRLVKLFKLIPMMHHRSAQHPLKKRCLPTSAYMRSHIPMITYWEQSMPSLSLRQYDIYIFLLPWLQVMDCCCTVVRSRVSILTMGFCYATTQQTHSPCFIHETLSRAYLRSSLWLRRSGAFWFPLLRQVQHL